MFCSRKIFLSISRSSLMWFGILRCWTAEKDHCLQLGLHMVESAPWQTKLPVNATTENIHIYPEKPQLTVQNSSLELLKQSGEQYCVQWEHPDPEEFSELDFPQNNSVCTLMLKKIYLRTLNNHQGLLVTVYLEMMGTSSCTLILGTDGLSNFSFLF